MISLNLLSDEKKDELRKKILLEISANVLELLLVVSIVVAIVLLVSKIVLQNSFNETIAQGTLITVSYSGINQEIGKLNKQIREIEKIQKEDVSWSALLGRLSELAPPGIILRDSKIDAALGDAVISGLALTRAALIAYLDALEKSGLFLTLESPLSNIFERTNVNFTINAKLNLEKIREQYGR